MLSKITLNLIRLLIAAIGLVSPNIAAKITAYFFARPPRRKNRDWMKEFLDTSVNDYFELDEHRFKSYVWRGDRKGVLFLHGWKSNAARWKYLIAQLNDLNIDLIAVDAPGHGESGHPAFTPLNYANVVDLMIKKYQPKLIVAHSVGGYTALLHRYIHSPKNIKYVLMAPTFDIMLPITTMFKILKLSKRTREAYIKNIEQELGKKMIAIRADNLVSNVPPEGILLHDINDKILPFEDSKILASKCPNLNFHALNSNGHRMQNDDSEMIILDYIKSELG